MSLHPHRRRAMLSTMRAIGYVRVSTDKQADHGVSLEAQEAKIRAMAVVQGAEIVELIRGRRRVGEEPEQARNGTAARAGRSGQGADGDHRQAGSADRS